jgi:thiamine-phosphate pyrophosphorylase
MTANDSRLRGLYALTPELARTADLAACVRQALEGGARLVQYRAKSASADLALEQARNLVALCREFDVPLIVNDSIGLAVACGAQGVHLGREDADPRQAREALPHGLIGVSCYDDPARARAAAAAGADYVGVGSVFASATKPDALRAPLSRLAEAKAAGGLPVAAIGGITIDNARLAIDAGADMVAVISALFEAPDIRRAAHGFARQFDTPGPAGENERAQPRTV